MTPKKDESGWPVGVELLPIVSWLVDPDGVFGALPRSIIPISDDHTEWAIRDESTGQCFWPNSKESEQGVSSLLETWQGLEQTNRLIQKNRR